MNDELSALFKELKKEYIESLPKKFTILQNLLNDKNYIGLEEEFHKYKGSGKTYGLPEVTLVCEIGEKLALREPTDEESINDVVELFSQIKLAYTEGRTIDLSTHPLYLKLIKKA